MIQSRKTISFSDILLLLFLMHMLLPFVGYYTPGIVYMGNTILLYLVFFCRSGAEFNRDIYYAFPFLVLAIISLSEYLQLSVFKFALQMYGQLQTIFWPVFAYSIIKNQKLNVAKKVIIWTLICCVITVITTSAGVVNNPGAARILATISDTSSYEYGMYMKKNIGGFLFTYTIIGLFPMVICFWKQKRLNTILFAGLVALGGIFFVSVEYSTAILLYIYILTLIFMKRKTTGQEMIIWFFGGVVILCFGQPLLGKLFLFLAKNIDSFNVQVRMHELAEMMGAVDAVNIAEAGDVARRGELFMLSISSFLRNPLWGGGSVGGHSYILDMLGKYGLVGGISLFWVYQRIYSYMYKPFQKQPFFGYMLFSYVICIVMAVLNTNSCWFVVTCMVPLSGYYLAATNGYLRNRI